jgi:hypothetical protein
MREECEFRVVEEFAARLFADNEGQRLGTGVRKINLCTDDPRFNQVGKLQQELRATMGRSFFHGWSLRRRYSHDELAIANCLNWKVTTVFEPAGEECGTKYDESTACSRCGAGAKRGADLFLNLKRIPKTRDISRTIAGETVVSARLVELFKQHRITGVEFRPVCHSSASSSVSKDWFSLHIQSREANITPPTRAGIGPFDDDAVGEYRCPQGDLIGLNILSEVSIEAKTRGADDIVCTRQYLGVRRGLLRPVPLVLISTRVWRLLESEKLKGWEVEVAHQV